MQYQVVKTLAVHCHCDVCSVTGGDSAGCRTSWSVYSIMPQWWHLMMLQYVAASFHLPSVSTANIDTVQYTKPYSNMKYQQSQLLWYPRCCFLSPTSQKPLSTATAVSDVSPGLPTYSNHDVTQYIVIVYKATRCWHPQPRAQNIQLPTYSSTRTRTLRCSSSITQYKQHDMLPHHHS